MPNTGGANPLAHDLKVHRQHCSPTAPNICWPFVTQNGDHSVHRVLLNRIGRTQQFMALTDSYGQTNATKSSVMSVMESLELQMR